VQSVNNVTVMLNMFLTCAEWCSVPSCCDSCNYSPDHKLTKYWPTFKIILPSYSYKWFMWIL